MTAASPGSAIRTALDLHERGTPSPVREEHNTVPGGDGRDRNSLGADAAEQVESSFVSANRFDELGYGRCSCLFSDALDAEVAAPEAVLGFRFWQTRPGGDQCHRQTVYLDRSRCSGRRGGNFPASTSTYRTSICRLGCAVFLSAKSVSTRVEFRQRGDDGRLDPA